MTQHKYSQCREQTAHGNNFVDGGGNDPYWTLELAIGQPVNHSDCSWGFNPTNSTVLVCSRLLSKNVAPVTLVERGDNGNAQ